MYMMGTNSSVNSDKDNPDSTLLRQDSSVLSYFFRLHLLSCSSPSYAMLTHWPNLP